MFTASNDTLEAQFTFENFTQAFAFMTEVAFEAEKMNHHPRWENTYNVVSIYLNTHDAGNTITPLDNQLADIITKIYIRYSS